MAIPQDSILLVTQDEQAFSAINFGGLTSPSAVREFLLSRMHVRDDDMPSCAIYQSSMGTPVSADSDSALSDGQLWDIATKAKDLPRNHVLVVRKSGLPPPDSAPPLSAGGYDRQARARRPSHSKNGSGGLSDGLIEGFFMRDERKEGGNSPEQLVSPQRSDRASFSRQGVVPQISPPAVERDDGYGGYADEEPDQYNSLQRPGTSMAYGHDRRASDGSYGPPNGSRRTSDGRMPPRIPEAGPSRLPAGFGPSGPVFVSPHPSPSMHNQALPPRNVGTPMQGGRPTMLGMGPSGPMMFSPPLSAGRVASPRPPQQPMHGNTLPLPARSLHVAQSMDSMRNHYGQPATHPPTGRGYPPGFVPPRPGPPMPAPSRTPVFTSPVEAQMARFAGAANADARDHGRPSARMSAGMVPSQSLQQPRPPQQIDPRRPSTAGPGGRYPLPPPPMPQPHYHPVAQPRSAGLPQGAFQPVPRPPYPQPPASAPAHSRFPGQISPQPRVPAAPHFDTRQHINLQPGETLQAALSPVYDRRPSYDDRLLQQPVVVQGRRASEDLQAARPDGRLRASSFGRAPLPSHEVSPVGRHTPNSSASSSSSGAGRSPHSATSAQPLISRQPSSAATATPVDDNRSDRPSSLSSASSSNPTTPATDRSAVGLPVSRQHKQEEASELYCDDPTDDGSGTATAPSKDWARSVMSSIGMSGDGESTIGKTAAVPKFDNFDDDDEAQTWQLPPSSSNTVNSTDSSKTVRPVLHINMPSTEPSTRSPMSARTRTPDIIRSPRVSGGLLAKSSGSPIQRKNSFREDEFRPPVSKLVDNLDAFFPGVDLDKPITTIEPVQPAIKGKSSESKTNSKLFRHRSIRQAAVGRDREAKRESEKASQPKSASSRLAPIGVARSLLRRNRSTKLWGSKVQEVQPHEVGTINEVVEDPENASFKWVKGDLIGRGSYGRVYLAMNVTTGDVLAVKQVEMPKTSGDRDDERQTSVVASLKGEIETLKDLDHPHIVQYLGFEETTDFLSIFLEYVPGGSVGRCIKRLLPDKCEEPVVRSLTFQILEGLSYLHGKGILHRDLKADNVLLDTHGICKISDFGVSKRAENVYQADVGMSMQGSIFWMAPEVVHNERRGYSAKVDIWALGCVVLEMFAGRRPWDTEQAMTAMFKIGAERLAPPVPEDVKLSSAAEQFLSDCFIVDPDKRPTATDLMRQPLMELDSTWSFESSNLYRAMIKTARR